MDADSRWPRIDAVPSGRAVTACGAGQSARARASCRREHRGDRHAGQDRARGAFRHRGYAQRFEGILPRPHLDRASRPAARHPGTALAADGSIRHRDDAVVAQCAGDPGNPNPTQANDMARKANDFLAEEVRKRPIAFRALRHCRCRIPIWRQENCSAACVSSASKARWSTASHRSTIRTRRSITTSSNTGRSGALWKSSTCRSICIRAIRCRAMRASMKATPG